MRRYGDTTQKAKWGELTGQVEIGQFDEIIASLFPDTEEDQPEVVKLPNEFLSLANKARSLLSRRLATTSTDEALQTKTFCSGK